MVSKELTLHDVINLHNEIERRYNITRGVNLGLLESIICRPNLKPYAHVPFRNVYSKCASLIEGIIKWHPFIDGNKRTGLAVAIGYMQKHDYKIVIPLDAVRFSVLIARNEKNIGDITKWVRMLSAKEDVIYCHKLDQYLLKPAHMLRELYNTHQEEKAHKILGDWLAFEIYPEYKAKPDQAIDFLIDIIERELLKLKADHDTKT